MLINKYDFLGGYSKVLYVVYMSLTTESGSV